MATKAKKTTTSKSSGKSAQKKSAAKKKSPSSAKKAQTAKKKTTQSKTGGQKKSSSKSSAQKSASQRGGESDQKSAAKRSAKSSSAKSSGQSSAKKTAAKAKSPKNRRQKLFNQLRKMLQDERQQLVQKALKMQNIKESEMHGDIVDQSNDYLDRELLMGLAEHDRQRLQEIDEALARMEAGTYGICQMSGEEISDERLLAMPTAKYTLECQAKLEGRY